MKLLYYSAFAIGAALFASCDVDKTEQGEAPELDVDVEAESGEMPEYDVDWANVNVGTRTKTMKVPKVVVVMEEEEVEVPYLDMKMPNSDEESTERSIKVEAEVSGNMHELEIEKVYATKNKLIVVSELEKEDDPLKENRVRVSDQIIINAPDNLVVSHYIIGEKPDGDFNNSYRYIASESDISNLTTNAKVIYKD
ncbi:hypothetical protein E1176_08170 [Fulvivirga sp. RKSG066]|uniref:hypothetical protein n=1 Tax=Fulvivirga aurantia TaxID=2529383 RepID=UPI0012BC924F|nr:hypothetical protein [Fulvivirga aurantia]MTI20995.1 hypothetical protein [Fulvivirga aurantia]